MWACQGVRVVDHPKLILILILGRKLNFGSIHIF